MTGKPKPEGSQAGCIPASLIKKPEATVKRKRRKPGVQKKELEAKYGDYLVGTDKTA